jgi:hypothetical protein
MFGRHATPNNEYQKLPLTPMGVLAPGSANARHECRFVQAYLQLNIGVLLNADLNLARTKAPHFPSLFIRICITYFDPPFPAIPELAILQALLLKHMSLSMETSPHASHLHFSALIQPGTVEIACNTGIIGYCFIWFIKSNANNLNLIIPLFKIKFIAVCEADFYSLIYF